MSPEIPDVAPGETIQVSWGNPIRSRTVLRYPSAAARDASVPVPVSGDVAWLEDVNSLTLYDGSSWVAQVDQSDTVTFLRLSGGTVTGTTTFTSVLNVRDGPVGTVWSTSVEPDGRFRWFTAGNEYMTLRQNQLSVLSRIDIDEFAGRPQLRIGNPGGDVAEWYSHGVRRRLDVASGDIIYYEPDGSTISYTRESGFGLKMEIQDQARFVARNIGMFPGDPTVPDGINGDVWIRVSAPVGIWAKSFGVWVKIV